MTCNEIQQSLLQGHELTGAITAHLARCAACAAVEEKIVALNRAVRALPAPTEMNAARDRFLVKLAGARRPLVRPAPQPIHQPQPSVLFRIVRSRWAVAAVLALAVGGGTWAYLEHRAGTSSSTIAQNPSPAPVKPEAPMVQNLPPANVPVIPAPAPERLTHPVAPPPVAPMANNTPAAPPVIPVGPTTALTPAVAVAPFVPSPAVNEILGFPDELLAQLVSHNVELSEIPSADQRRVAFKGGAGLRQKVRSAKLSPSDRKVADALLGDSEWLAEHNDPLATADRFGEVADLLAERMTAPGASPEILSNLGKSYYMVLDRGISQNLDKAKAGGALTADHQKRLAGVAQNHERLQHRIEQLMEKYPNATRQQILKAIEAAKLQHRKKQMGQQTGPGKPGN